MMKKQAELQYQLNASNLSLEKQMRKMRRKFERALQATDERFLEQKKREEIYHDHLKSELELIEKSLEKGSKKNVEDFSDHVRTELNNLAEKLTNSMDLNDRGERTQNNNKIQKRASAVDLDKDISVSLAISQSTTTTTSRSAKKERNNNLEQAQGN